MSDSHHTERIHGQHGFRSEIVTQARNHGQQTNAKLDVLLSKISSRLTSMKKHKRGHDDQKTEVWSDHRSDHSQPTHKSAPTRNNRLETDRSMEEHDPMKQVELGLIYSKGVPSQLLEGNEYFQDFMNLLVDDASQSLKSQELTQDSSSGRTAGKRVQEEPPRKQTKGLPPQEPAPASNLKQRMYQTISKVENVLKNFKQNQELQRMKNSFREGDR